MSATSLPAAAWATFWAGRLSVPDRDESVAIREDQLQPSDGAYRLIIAEPMDEIAYLDQLVLNVVDRPPGISALPTSDSWPADQATGGLSNGKHHSASTGHRSGRP